jgi:HEAT repeat protein
VLGDNPVDKALDEGKVSAAAGNALFHILPTLDEYNCAEMNTGLTVRLCRLLRHRDAGLVIEAVEALGRVGNGTAMAPVEQLAEKSKNEVVREKALLILPILKERRRLEELHGTLLRASGLPTADHALLRPAAHAGNDNAKELLRSVGED